MAGGGPGGRGGGGGEMRAFNQSLSAQVQSAMRLPERLVSRSQPPSHLAPRRLGEPAAAAEEDATAPAEGRDEDVALAAATAAKEGERRVAELYDDADFYEQVLKEFLESAGAASPAPPPPPSPRSDVRWWIVARARDENSGTTSNNHSSTFARRWNSRCRRGRRRCGQLFASKA